MNNLNQPQYCTAKIETKQVTFYCHLDDLLLWVREKIPECNMWNWTASWRDGRAVAHLCEAIKPGSFPVPLSTLIGQDPLKNAEMGANCAELELEIPKLLEPCDLISGADQLSTMTDIFFSMHLVNHVDVI